MRPDNRQFWLEMWNQRAHSDTMYGRDSWSFADFCLLLHDMSRAVGFSCCDTVLDAGGGTGAVAMALAPFVKHVTLFDIGCDILAKARQDTASFENIEVFEDDVMEMRNITRTYSRVIVGSVIQYLNSYDDVFQTLRQVRRCLETEGKALFTHNPDLSQKEAHLASYSRLQWEPTRLRAALEIEERRLWVDKETFSEMALELGFKRSYETPIHPTLWQSTHMFDWVLER
jgi:ubiquinone/menaquinone biosynthesis C-methylase UbiE